MKHDILCGMPDSCDIGSIGCRCSRLKKAQADLPTPVIGGPAHGQLRQERDNYLRAFEVREPWRDPQPKVDEVVYERRLVALVQAHDPYGVGRSVLDLRTRIDVESAMAGGDAFFEAVAMAAVRSLKDAIQSRKTDRLLADLRRREVCPNG